MLSPSFALRYVGVSSRRVEKDRRRREREAAEQAARLAERRRRRRRLIGVGIASMAAVAVVVMVILRAPEGDRADVFAAKPDGLAERMAEARLQAGGDHIHPTLKVFTGDTEVPVPDDIGVGEGGTLAPVHKHPGDATLHAEGVREGSLTLDQVMSIWDVELSPSQLGPYRAEGPRRVRMWVKAPGESRFRDTREFGRLILRDGQEIYLSYGTAAQSPIAE